MVESSFTANECSDIVERLIALETTVRLKFEEWDKALIIAKDLVETDKILARDGVKEHFEKINRFQSRMDKLEATFATKDDLTLIRDSIANLKRLVYIGVGVAMSIQFAAKFIPTTFWN